MGLAHRGEVENPFFLFTGCYKKKKKKGLQGKLDSPSHQSA